MINIKEVYDIEIEGVDSKDFPDFTDSFISMAYTKGRECTEEEMDYLQQTYPELVNELAFESLIL